jgi:exodeoxyribonuclease V alpha subunit
VKQPSLIPPTDSAGPPLASLEGVVERITFSNPENHYAVLRLKVKGRRDPATVVGALATAREGEHLVLKGRYEVHPRYGEQFQVVWWYAVLPATVAGIQKYLASGVIKGIGVETARRLVEKFGADTLKVIEEKPEKLLEVAGFGPKRLKQIITDWHKHQESREVLVALQGLGLSMAFATRLYQQYGSQTVEVVTTNPYQAALDVHGFGFLSADRLAAKLNLDPLAPARLGAGLVHSMDDMAGNGHVYCPEEALLQQTAALLKTPPEPLQAVLTDMVREGRLVRQDLAGGRGVYKRPAWVAETGVARLLSRLYLTPAPMAPLNFPELLERVQNRRGLKLSPEQAQAVTAAFREKILIITGGPGTGKTTIISCILDLYRGLGARVALMAPTGRAAKRLSETTGAEAKTIHRALEFSPQEGGFRRNAAEPLKAEVIVVDEMSMVDNYLMYHLLKAVPPASRLILVGDAYQLPSVGPGNVLKDLLDSGVLPVTRLTQIYRQARESLIVVNAHRINQGVFPVLPQKFGKTDFVFMEFEDPEALHQRLLELTTRYLPQRYGLNPVKDIQVITPMHRGGLGVPALNQLLQRQLNPQGDIWLWGDRHFRRLDKVMQLRNNYQKEVFNGDVGQVWGYEADSGQLQVKFDGRLITYEPGEREELTLAYAVTVHKSQGNEFPAVILVLTTQHYMMLQRNLLYTALTRGRRLVVILGSKKALAMAINNDRPIQRYTNLASLMKTALLNTKTLPPEPLPE